MPVIKERLEGSQNITRVFEIYDEVKLIKTTGPRPHPVFKVVALHLVRGRNKWDWRWSTYVGDTLEEACKKAVRGAEEVEKVDPPDQDPPENRPIDHDKIRAQQKELGTRPYTEADQPCCIGTAGGTMCSCHTEPGQ
jgi:hypothetical protein